MSPKAKRTLVQAASFASLALVGALQSQATLYIDLRPDPALGGVYDPATHVYTVTLNPAALPSAALINMYVRVVGTDGSNQEGIAYVKYAVYSTVGSGGAAVTGNLAQAELNSTFFSQGPNTKGTTGDFTPPGGTLDGIGDLGWNTSTLPASGSNGVDFTKMINLRVSATPVTTGGTVSTITAWGPQTGNATEWLTGSTAFSITGAIAGANKYTKFQSYEYFGNGSNNPASWKEDTSNRLSLSSLYPVRQGTTVLFQLLAPSVTSTTYTLGADAPTSLNLLKGGSLPTSAIITNIGTGTADTLSYTGLGFNTGNALVATSSGTKASSSPLAKDGGTENTSGTTTVSGVDYGTATLTAKVTTATNATMDGNPSATFSGPAGTIEVNVGNATADTSGIRSNFGGPLSAAVSGSYAGLSSKVVNPTGALNSEAWISSAGTVTATEVSMAWRTRLTDEISRSIPLMPTPFNPDFDGAAGLASDVVRINGTGGDLYKLEIQYDQQAIATILGYSGPVGDQYQDWNNFEIAQASAHNIGLAKLIGETNPIWTLQGTGPIGGNWGVNTETNVVWAVVNSGGQFAAVPEPATLGLLGMAALGLTIRRRRRTA